MMSNVIITLLEWFVFNVPIGPHYTLTLTSHSLTTHCWYIESKENDVLGNMFLGTKKWSLIEQNCTLYWLYIDPHNWTHPYIWAFQLDLPPRCIPLIYPLQGCISAMHQTISKETHSQSLRCTFPLTWIRHFYLHHQLSSSSKGLTALILQGCSNFSLNYNRIKFFSSSLFFSTKEK